ncbi:MAG: pantetheine-phosphate adenylyltransferase [Clostridia bacterium]|nr:pantetheine-phosphate adenylyltransferase [Clostridia bacterium]
MSGFSEHVCVYPGSFDPITLGHMDIVKRARVLFGTVIVAILHNETKQSLFTLSERKHIATLALTHMPDVRVETYDGLLTDFMVRSGAKIIVRGLRSGNDYDDEMKSAGLRQMLTPDIETVFLPAAQGFAYISASAAREIASFGGDILLLLPEASRDALEGKAIKKQTGRNEHGITR